MSALIAYWRYLRETRAELAIVFAIAGVVLTVLPNLAITVAGWFSKSLAQSLALCSYEWRLAWIGLPAALAFLAWAFLPGYLAWRKPKAPDPLRPRDL